jgi:hypothetical protein
MSKLLKSVVQTSKQRKLGGIVKVVIIASFAVGVFALGLTIGSGAQAPGRIEFIKTQVISLFIGITGGIMTAFLLWYANRNVDYIWQKIADNISTDIKVTGIWVEKYQPVIHKETLQKQDLILDLRQEGIIINGTIKADDSASCPENEKKGLRMFDVQGQSKDEMIGLDCILRSSNKKGRVQYLLRFAGDGSRLVGWTTYFDIQNEILTAAECEFYRIEDPKDASDARKELNENRDASLGDIANGIIN